MIRILLNLYIILLIVDIILSYFPGYRQESWRKFIKRMADFTCMPIRKYLPPDIPFDPSPLIVILGIKIFESIW